MATGRFNKLTGQIGEYIACAELGRQGFLASAFSGNVPEFDLVVVDESLKSNVVQVKSTRNGNWRTDANTWMILDVLNSGHQVLRGPKLIANPNLLYIFVAIGDASHTTSDRFFILNASEVQIAYIKSYSYYMEQKNWIRPTNPYSFDCRINIIDIIVHENKWEKIRDQLTGLRDKPTSADGPPLLQTG